MKNVFAIGICFTLVCNAALSQNVGVGTTTPTEKLDVNGNVNVSGALKVNGNAGSSGQVLTSTGSGLSWASMAGYKKCIVFQTPGSGTWTIPAGVSEIMVELWGGGSGGNEKVGGSSGSYSRAVHAVTPGYVVNFSIGSGSNAGAASTIEGQSSQVTLPSGYISAAGGGGVISSSYTARGSTNIGATSLTNNYFLLPGTPGEATHYQYGQKSATIFTQTSFYGAGGTPPGLLNYVVQKGDLIYYENGSIVYSIYNGSGTRFPAEGGAAGISTGYPGGNGMIIFWFN